MPVTFVRGGIRTVINPIPLAVLAIKLVASDTALAVWQVKAATKNRPINLVFIVIFIFGDLLFGDN